jgi:hypothetical protein
MSFRTRERLVATLCTIDGKVQKHFLCAICTRKVLGTDWKVRLKGRSFLYSYAHRSCFRRQRREARANG